MKWQEEIKQNGFTEVEIHEEDLGLREKVKIEKVIGCEEEQENTDISRLLSLGEGEEVTKTGEVVRRGEWFFVKGGLDLIAFIENTGTLVLQYDEVEEGGNTINWKE